MPGMEAPHRDLNSWILDLVRSNRSGVPVGLPSICSANRFVLEAAMQQAQRDDSVVAIESTSNQVNQFGGYTGMTPDGFARFIRTIAGLMNFPLHRVLLGGDHLGPHVWQDEPSESAMAKARELVGASVRAGYVKIHLDASMRCVDDPRDEKGGLAPKTITERTADLCEAAESAYLESPEVRPAPVYVIGTEVPPPGGENAGAPALSVTSPADVEETLRLARRAFAARGLERAWGRVVGVVVQPGVEFGDSTVLEYDREKARELSRYITQNWHVVYEAHSTDYQTLRALKEMVEDHFAFLKVGPWLTFAFREAVCALEAMEREWLSAAGGVRLSGLNETLERVMLENPKYWIRYYPGDEASQRFARKYSYSDRARYYWPHPAVQESLAVLLKNLSDRPTPLTLLSQHLPNQYQGVRAGRLSTSPSDLIRDKIMEVLDLYAAACGRGTR